MIFIVISAYIFWPFAWRSLGYDRPCVSVCLVRVIYKIQVSLETCPRMEGGKSEVGRVAT